MQYCRAVKCLLIAALLIINIGRVKASILDSDFYCRVYGCVMISDGFGTDVYDVYNFASGRTVQVGSPLIPWTGNPIFGVGPMNIVETGTTSPARVFPPSASYGTRLSIDSNGDHVGDLTINDNNSNGYLDASDLLSSFTITNATDVVYQDNRLRHSFYLTSRNTRFEIRARSSISNAISGYGAVITLSDISFSISITRTGQDTGIFYGNLATNGRFVQRAGIDDLGDISGVMTMIAEFNRRQGIRRESDNINRHVYRQSLRFDLSYGYPPLDLSYGSGAVQFRVEYAPYKR